MKGLRERARMGFRPRARGARAFWRAQKRDDRNRQRERQHAPVSHQ